ncbi:WXG100 family type VII secretion target [Kitasatospora sp. NPDC058965]|uniref:WXG100 family type VII secretion target n=1 Tax=Kitasatospora sp. NPDC058965 TaxID=3346682 RepID=UPI003680B7B4
MITPAPAVYAGAGSGTTIAVDPELLVNLGKQVLGMLEGIGADVAGIFTTLGDLELGWAGQTADEAKEFFDRLDACLTALYGRAGDADSAKTSLVGRVAAALDIAGNNYLAAEDAIVDLFYFTGSVSDTAIWDSHNGKGGGGGDTAITDPGFTAIGETY